MQRSLGRVQFHWKTEPLEGQNILTVSGSRLVDFLPEKNETVSFTQNYLVAGTCCSKLQS
jgi:hypothetical protein